MELGSTVLLLWEMLNVVDGSLVVVFHVYRALYSATVGFVFPCPSFVSAEVVSLQEESLNMLSLSSSRPSVMSL
jgi:hypothetical protein